MSLTNDIDFSGRLRGTRAVPASGPAPGHVVKIPDYSAVGTRPAWHEDAACRVVDRETFFPESGRGPFPLQIAAAKAVCERCTVIDSCLRWALDSEQDWGIWGGLAEHERARLTGKKADPAERTRALNRADQFARVAKAARLVRQGAASGQPAPTRAHVSAAAAAAPATRARMVPGLLTLAEQQRTLLTTRFENTVQELASSQPPITVPVRARPGDRRRALTAFETQVLELVAQGETATDIGEHLTLSVPTVKTHKRNIADALGATGDSGHSVALGYACGYLQPHPYDLPAPPSTQIEVLLLLAEGKNNTLISELLFRSEDTVKSRLRLLFKQLGVTSRTQAVDAAFRSGLFIAQLIEPEAMP